MIASRRIHHRSTTIPFLWTAWVVLAGPSHAEAKTPLAFLGSSPVICETTGLAPQEPPDCIVRPRPGPKVALIFRLPPSRVRRASASLAGAFGVGGAEATTVGKAEATTGAEANASQAAAGRAEATASQGAGSQNEPLNRDALGERIKQRYDVIPLRDAIGLAPKRPVAGVRMIELSRGTIAIDGEVVTGRELSERIGADADLIVQLTYLDERLRRELLGITEAPRATPDQTATPPSSTTDVPPAAEATAPDQATGQEQSEAPRRTTKGDTIRFGEDVTIGRNEIVAGDLVVIGGAGRVEGEVTGEVVIVGGSLYLGPEAIVRRDVAVIGGSLDRQPGARIEGKVNDVRFGRNFQWRGMPPFVERPWNMMTQVAGVIVTLVRIGLLVLLGCIIVAISPTLVERIGERAAEEPLKAGAVGLLVQILFIPVLVLTIVMLVISIIGIPLLAVVPLALVAGIITLLIGFTGIAERIGRLTAARFGWNVRGPYLSLAVGVLVLMGLTLIYKIMAIVGGVLAVIGLVLAIVGVAIEYVAWTVGLGATILLRFARRQPPATTVLEPPPPAVA